MIPAGKSCETCVYFVPEPEGGVTECRRFPPASTGNTVPRWPLVRPEHWCGEYSEVWRNR